MESHPSLAMFFGAAAILGGVLFVIRLILFLLGSDGGDMDAGGGHLEGGSDSSFEFISLQGVAGFFMMFGLVGLAMLSGNAGVAWSLVSSISAGVITLLIVGFLFRSMRRLQSDGTLRISNAIGKEGTVYLTIPPSGSGQVRVAVQGAFKIFDAISADQQRIPTGSGIRVVKVMGSNILVVEKLQADPEAEAV